MFFRAFKLFARREPPAPAVELLRDLDRVDTLPVLSDTALRAMALVNDPDATLADVGDLIRRDGALVAALLKLANSAAYGGRQQVESLPRATARLGLKGCYQVLTALGMRGAFGRSAVGGDVLLRHALFTGTLASRLSAAGGLAFRGEEFAAGMLHDIGRVVIAARAPAAVARADLLTFREDGDTLARERAALGTDHCAIGARFAEVNNLPVSVTAAIRHHHAPADAPEYPVLTALVAAADAVANHAQTERNLTAFRPRRAPGFARLPALVGADTAAAIEKAVPDAVVTALRETRAMLRVTS
jgi:HD-like signal output (HDOD) protein